MKTFLRYDISVQTKQYPFKAPREIEELSQELFLKCSKYSIVDQTMLLLVPIDVPEYNLIMKFKSDYPEYTSKLVIYEHKYSKKEIEEAEFLLLKSKSMVILQNNKVRFEKCCEKGKFSGKQINSFIINKNQFQNKVISGTNVYRYLVSIEAKEKLEETEISNIIFIPVYSVNNSELVAYQIEVQSLLQSLEPYNNWGIYKKCENCGKILSNTKHNFPQPFMIPKDYMKELKDFNATSEVFTELASRYYIISKKMYKTLQILNAKKLICEPIKFID